MRIAAIAGFGLLPALLVAPTTSQAVLVPATTVFADTFTRSVSNGFGAPDLGTAYAAGETSGLSVGSGVGTIALASGAQREQISRDILPANTDATATFIAPALTGGAVYLTQKLRLTADGGHLQSRLKLTAGGSAHIGWRAVNEAGALHQLGADTPAAFTWTKGMAIKVRTQTINDQLRLKAWDARLPEPEWQATATSPMPAVPGRFGITAYLSAASAAATLGIDDIHIRAMEEPNERPTAAFTPTASGLTATFDGSASADPDGNITEYSWDFGDGSQGTGLITNHTYSAAGTYQVTLSVTDNRGSRATTTRTTSVTYPRPTALNTGVPAGTALKVVTGNLTVTTPGTVIDGVDLRGSLTIKASNVTVRRSIIRGTPTPPTRASGLLNVTTAGTTGTVIHDVTIAPQTLSPHWNGIYASQPATITRVNISRSVDGIVIYGNGITVRNSLIHALTHFAADPNQGGKASHDDGIQVQAGRNILISHNTISGAWNAAVQITQDAGITQNLHINNNWVDGGGCSLNYKSNGAYKTGMQANGNVFGAGQRVGGCAIIHNAAASDLNPSGNVWAATGSPVTPKRGA